MSPRKTLLTSLQIGLLTAGLAGNVRAGAYDQECRDRKYAECDHEYYECERRAEIDPYWQVVCDDNRNSCEGAAENETSEEREESTWYDRYEYEEESGGSCRMVADVTRGASYQEYCYDGSVGDGWTVETIEHFEGDWYSCDLGS